LFFPVELVDCGVESWFGKHGSSFVAIFVYPVSQISEEDYGDDDAANSDIVWTQPLCNFLLGKL